MQGVIAAAPTAIDGKGVPQKDPFLAHCQWALANGCDGLNILGSTGEANSFGSDDRKTVMRWAAEGLDVGKLMVGTGTPALSETIDLTQHANDLGYSVALVLPPYYYAPLSDQGLIDWYTAVHDALGDAAIQIYFYNYPQMTGLKIPVSVIATLADRIPNRFTGIKDSSGDLDYCREIIAAAPAMRVFPSSETSLEQAHASGFAGCISATVNITAALSAKVWDTRTNPDADAAAKIAQQRKDIAGRPLIPAIKYLVGHMHNDPIWQNVVPPFVRLDAAAGADLVANVLE